jgi:hypothetical protein
MAWALYAREVLRELAPARRELEDASVHRTDDPLSRPRRCRRRTRLARRDRSGSGRWAKAERLRDAPRTVPLSSSAARYALAAHARGATSWRGACSSSSRTQIGPPSPTRFARASTSGGSASGPAQLPVIEWDVTVRRKPSRRAGSAPRARPSATRTRAAARTGRGRRRRGGRSARCTGAGGRLRWCARHSQSAKRRKSAEAPPARRVWWW